MSDIEQRAPRAGETWDVAALSQGKADFVTLLGSYIENADPASIPTIPHLSLHYLRFSTEADSQRPHREDEAYFVLSGRGAITIDGVMHRLERGTLIWVPRAAEHRFHDFEAEGLELLVIFSPQYSGR